MKIKIGSRGSELALWQARHVASMLGPVETEIIVIKTRGDIELSQTFNKMEGKGFFTKEIEEALLRGDIDMAVHSCKDLTTEDIPGLEIAAYTQAEDPADTVLVHEDRADMNEPLFINKNSVLGSGSARRAAFAKSFMPGLKIRPLRGNVNTRIQKLLRRDFDAIILASAGLARISPDTGSLKLFRLDPEIFMPAPAQGVLAVQTRSGPSGTGGLARRLNHGPTSLRVRAERSFLKCYGGGCHIPLGAFSRLDEGLITLTGAIASVNGPEILRETLQGRDPEKLGEELARKMKEKGAVQ